jgi:hypothetical protein
VRTNEEALRGEGSARPPLGARGGGVRSEVSARPLSTSSRRSWSSCRRARGGGAALEWAPLGRRRRARGGGALEELHQAVVDEHKEEAWR